MLLLRSLLIGSALAAVGCTVEIPGEQGGPDDSSGGGGGSGSSSDGLEGKLSNNGLVFSPAAVAELPLAGLGVRQSTSEVLADPAAASALGEIPDGLDHLRYSALCALEQGDSLLVETASGTISYPGLYGLATNWAEGACDGSCQRWVTACLLAHTNKAGQSVPLSLRGGHPGLEWDRDIEQTYALQEAAFYGNAFAGTSEGVFPTLYACFGRALVDFDDDTSGGGDYPDDYLLDRVCSTGNCGFDSIGPCHYPIQQGAACGSDAGLSGYYGNCKGSWVNEEREAGDDPIYPEVITSYLIPQ